jgi:hypothetical protein
LKIAGPLLVLVLLGVALAVIFAISVSAPSSAAPPEPRLTFEQLHELASHGRHALGKVVNVAFVQRLPHPRGSFAVRVLSYTFFASGRMYSGEVSGRVVDFASFGKGQAIPIRYLERDPRISTYDPVGQLAYYERGRAASKWLLVALGIGLAWIAAYHLLEWKYRRSRINQMP